MSSAIDNSAFIHYNNHVTVHDVFQSVGYHYDGFPPGEFIHRLLHRKFVVYVKTGCYFIKKNNRGILQHAAGNTDSLSLPATEIASFLRHNVIRTCEINHGLFQHGSDIIS